MKTFKATFKQGEDQLWLSKTEAEARKVFDALVPFRGAIVKIEEVEKEVKDGKTE